MSLTIAGPNGITVIIEAPPITVIDDSGPSSGGDTPDGTTDPGTGTGGAGGGGNGRQLTYTQDSPSKTWTIRHGAATAPAVTVLNTAGVEVFVRTRHDTSLGVVYIEPDFAFAGRAFLRWNTTT